MPGFERRTSRPAASIIVNSPFATATERMARHDAPMTRVLIAGATGWTGAPLAEAVRAADDLELAGGIARSGADFASVDAALAGAQADVLVDFTSAASCAPTWTRRSPPGCTSSSAPQG